VLAFLDEPWDLNIPQDRNKAMATMATPTAGQPTAKSIDSVADMIETEQNEWTEEAVETGAVDMLNVQLNTLLMEESNMLGKILKGLGKGKEFP
jgi:hypothetical protein